MPEISYMGLISEGAWVLGCLVKKGWGCGVADAYGTWNIPVMV